MSHGPGQAPRFGTIGFGLGAALVLMGCVEHPYRVSTGTPLRVFGAPLSFLGDAAVVFGVPLVWGLLGRLLDRAEKAWARWVILLVVVPHYALVVALLTGGGAEFDFGARTGAGSPNAVVWIWAVYLAGQAGLWYGLCRPTLMALSVRRGRHDGHIFSPGTRRLAQFSAIGLGFGLLLLLADLAAYHFGTNRSCQARQGLSAILSMYSSPFGLLPGGATVYGTLILWGLFGALVGLADRRWARVAILILLMVHYAGIAFLLPNRAFGDWRCFEKDWSYVEGLWWESPGAILLALLAYLAGQAAVWRALLGRHAPPGPEPARRPWQFSLRTLLLLPLGLAILLGWPLTEYRRAARCQAAIRAIQKAAGAGRGHDCVQRFEVPVSSKMFSDYFENEIAKDWKLADQWDPAPGIRELYQVNLSGTKVADADLAVLKDLPNLYTLNLNDTAITDAGLVHLQRVAALGYLQIVSTRVTSEGVARLQQAAPRLRIRRE